MRLFIKKIKLFVSQSIYIDYYCFLFFEPGGRKDDVVSVQVILSLTGLAPVDRFRAASAL